VSLLKTLFLAARPKTLTAGLSPVLIGTSLAWSQAEDQNKGFDFIFTALITLFTALLIQVLTNYVNDLWDYKKGSDTEIRIGPARALASGRISQYTMERCIYVLTLIILLCGIYLVIKGGVPILIIGILSIIGAYAYTAGPYPLAHNGLGETFVLLFFGPIAVMGTEYLLLQENSLASFIFGISAGCLATVILVINNMRDIQEDQITGKRTLAARFGKNFALNEILLLYSVPFILCLCLAITDDKYSNLVFLILLIPFPYMTIRKLYKISKGEDFNILLAQSGAFLLIFSLILSFSILI
jgi:1,4-dihydroxy-2-naphthoate octaprenyltransferase